MKCPTCGEDRASKLSWRGMVVRVAGLALAAYLVHSGHTGMAVFIAFLTLVS